MLKLFPGYLLLLGLACQFGHAQRSGGTFSILSESTGPLVADGNTTTGFSQSGATEAIQGTFSSATTGVTGTIGFLSQQSSSSVDPASSFTVSGGQSGAPYYQFIDGNGQTPDFTSLLLNPGKSYKFTASGVSNSHPFMIGESYGDMNSSLVNGGPLSGSGGSITVTMPIDFNGSLYYFCTNHSGMFQEFSIRRPTNLNPIAPLTIAENQAIGTVVGDFNATNPDVNSTLTYHLASGAGDGKNSLFTLETNGTLKTATTFDYESNASTYSIRVQAKDEFNATVEGNFTVMLTDVFEDNDGDGIQDHIDPDDDNDRLSDALETTYGSDPFDSNSIASGLVIDKWYLDKEWGGISINSTYGAAQVFYEPNDNRAGGRIYVADNYDNKAHVFDSNGTKLFEITGLGWAKGIVVNDNDIIFCLFRNGLKAYDHNGSFLYSLGGGTGNGDGEFTLNTTMYGSEPQGALAIHPNNGRIYAVDGMNNRVQIFDVNGSFYSKFGTAGSSEGQFSDPKDLVFLPDGRLLVTDDAYLNYFDENGTFLKRVSASNARVAVRKDGKLWIGGNLRDMEGNVIRSPIPGGNRATFVSNGDLITVSRKVQYWKRFNYAPSDLNFTAPLTFAENQPIGSEVGEFNATNPDANSTLTYYFVSGAGDTHNTLFTLETNGTLKTATTFDYETNASTYSIRVQAKNEFNATVEGSFMVTLLDLYELNYDKDTFQSTINNLPNLNVSEVFVSGNSSSLNLIGSISIPNTLEVKIHSKGDLIISGSLSMNSEQDLILEAGGDIYINGGIFSKEDSGRLFLKFGLNSTNENNPNDYFINSPVNLPGGQNLLIKQGKDGNLTTYTVLTELGVQNSLTGIDLQGVKGNLSANYALGADLNASTTISWNGGSGFEPIGTASTPFTGNFEGLGHTIENLYIQRTSIDKVALFGRTFGSKISNLGVVNANIRGKREVSALIASPSSSLISRCFSSGTINGADENVAGLLAGIYGSTVINSYSHANATGTMYDVGGLGGELGFATIQNCYSTGKPQGASRVGGLVGVTFSASQIQNSFWDKQTSSRTTWGIDYHGASSVAAIGLTTIEMKSQTRFLNAGWDFNNTWVMPENDYPILRWQIRNSPPANLNSTALLAFGENQPIGTLVGEFNASDPDVNATLTYRFVSGVGDGNNSLFTLETNGTLKTATTFDYESNASTYSIRVQAKDEFNATVEGNFTVALLDINEGPYNLGVWEYGFNHFRIKTIQAGSTSDIDNILIRDLDTNETVYSNNFEDNNLSGLYLRHNPVPNATTEPQHTTLPNITDEVEDYSKTRIVSGKLRLETVGFNQNGSGGYNSYSYVINENPLPKNFELEIDSTRKQWAGGHHFHLFRTIDIVEQGGESLIYPSNLVFQSTMGGSTLNSAYIYNPSILNIRTGPSVSHPTFNYRLVKRGSTLDYYVNGDFHGQTDALYRYESNLSIAENQAMGTQIGSFNSVDPDGDDLTYQFVSGAGDGNNSLFTLDTIGTLRAATIFDFETNASTYSIRVQAKDEYNATVEGNFTVTLTDIFENSVPTNLNSTASLTFAENQPIGTIVGEFNATDPDVNATLTYYLVSGAGNGNNSLFSMDANGTLKTATAFDYETNASTYSIRVQVKDEFNATVEGNFTVMLTDVFEDNDGDGIQDHIDPDDDNDRLSDALEITYGSDPFDSNSIASGLVIDKWYLDKEWGGISINSTYGAAQVFYEPYDNRAGGRIYVADNYDNKAHVFDSNGTKLFEITGLGWAKGIVVNDNDIIFCLFRNGLKAYDHNGSFLYSLGGGTGNGDGEFTLNTTMYGSEPQGALAIHPNNGRIYAVDGMNNRVQIFDVNGSFYSKFGTAGSSEGQFSDPKDLAFLTDGRLLVTDDAYLNYFDENGTFLKRVSASNARVAVRKDGKLWIGGNLRDMEGNVIRSPIPGGNRATFVSNGDLITVSRKVQYWKRFNYAPSDLNFTAPLTIAENQAIGTVVGDFNATDPDANATLTYHLVSGAGDGNNSLFILETNGTLKTATTFDYESNVSTYTIRVQARDEHDAIIEENFSVTLTDLLEMAPNLPPSNLSVGEFGFNFFRVRARQAGSTSDLDNISIIDLDLNQTLYFNDFEENNLSGLILRHNPISSSPYEGGPAYIIDPFDEYLDNTKTRVVNGKLRLETIGFNRNGSGGYNSYSYAMNEVRLPENFDLRIDTIRRQWAGHQQFHILRDKKGVEEVFGSWMGGSTLNSAWLFNPSKKSIRTGPNASYPTLNYRLVKQGSSLDYYVNGILHGRTTTLARYDSNLSIAENLPVGSLVGKFTATDPDANSTLTYHLVSGVGDGNNSLFTFETNGTLKTATTFDYETNASTYSIRVQARDEYNATVEGNFTVTLTDVFDNQAPGTISIQFASLTENQPIGTVVGKLNAVDPEGDVVRYALINGSGSSGNKFFTVDVNGVLRTAVVFDFEQNASHSIRARALDESNGSREEVLNIQVFNQWEDPDGDGLENSYDLDDDNDGFSDIDEIAYGSDPLDPNSLPNRAPSEIFLSSERVEENMPIGTIVGQLVTTDLDDPNGTGVYQYSLLSNVTGTEFFSIDPNGTMLTKQELDFESNSSHTVELRVTDHLGAYLDQNITIQVVDTFIPIVETGDPVDVGFQEAILPGKLLDKGASLDPMEMGMLVSTDPNPNLNTKGIIRERGYLDAHDSFEAMMMGLEKGQKYFYRTYAINQEGVGYGVVKDFVTQKHANGPGWVNAQPGVAANWWTNSWFGSFYMNDANASWIMHSELGWLYPMASGKSGVWLWKENLGWLWTDEAFYPFLYQNTSAGWLYFYGASQGTMLFYHYRDERWLQIKNDRSID